MRREGRCGDADRRTKAAERRDQGNGELPTQTRCAADEAVRA
jgi:hypothetical protein